MSLAEYFTVRATMQVLLDAVYTPEKTCRSVIHTSLRSLEGKIMPTKSWLRDYFKRLANIEKKEMEDERALSGTVEIPIQGWIKGKQNLLQALGYDKGNVTPQYGIRVGTSKPKVDFMIGKDSNYWMLDLKRPHESNRPKYVEQMQSYLNQEKVALGVLFNGNWAMAYVNPEYPSISRIYQTITEQELADMPQLDLKKHPVKEAQLHPNNIQEMVAFFRPLRYDGGLPDIQTMATKLAEDYVTKLKRQLKTTDRTTKIQKALFEIMQNPDEPIASAIIRASNVLSNLHAKPTEVLTAWPTERFLSETLQNRKVTTKKL